MSSDIYFDTRTDREKIRDLECNMRSLWRQIDMLNDRVYELEKKLSEKEKEYGGEN